LLHEFPELEEVGAQGIGERQKQRRDGNELPRRKIRERASAVGEIERGAPEIFMSEPVK
jgi:hypothetical protein